MHRFQRLLFIGAVVGAIGLSSLALTAAAASVKDQMKTVVDPASTILFAVSGEVDPGNGPSAPPEPAARWKAAAAAAAKIKHVAASMLTPANTRPGAEWGAQSKQLLALADAAETAAQTKNAAKLTEAANGMGDVCTACHDKYRPKPAS